MSPGFLVTCCRLEELNNRVEDGEKLDGLIESDIIKKHV